MASPSVCFGWNKINCFDFLESPAWPFWCLIILKNRTKRPFNINIKIMAAPLSPYSKVWCSKTHKNRCRLAFENRCRTWNVTLGKTSVSKSFSIFFQELTQVHRWPGNHKSSFLRFRADILFFNLFLHQLAYRLSPEIIFFTLSQSSLTILRHHNFIIKWGIKYMKKLSCVSNFAQTTLHKSNGYRVSVPFTPYWSL